MNDRQASTPGATRRGGGAWAWGIAGAYGLFALATLAVVAFALTRQVDLVSGDTYQRQIEHQSHIDAVERTRALGLDWEVGAVAGALRFRFAPGTFGGALEGQIHFYRPGDAGLDRQVAIALDADGGQSVAADLAPGLWRVRIAWRADGHDYYSERELTVPAGAAP